MVHANLDKIAEKAGVSITTVSRVLSGKAQVREETRQRVLQAAGALEYRPNLLVRGLQTGKTGMVGVMGRIGDDFFAQIMRGIHDALAKDRCVPLLQITGKRPDGTHIGIPELEQLYALIDRRVDGIIMFPVDENLNKEQLQRLAQNNMPLVLVDRDLDYVDADFVGADDYSGGVQAAEFFLSRGHIRLGHLAGPDFTTTGRLRRQGFVEAAVAAGARVEVAVDRTFTGAVGCIAELWAQAPDITAIFAANDYMAASALRFLEEHRIRVPEEVEVLGFGDLEFGRWISPILSTFNQKPYEIGSAAARLMLERVEGRMESASRKIRFKPVLLERGTTR